MLEWVYLNFKELVSHVDQLFYILVVDLCSVWAHKAENKHSE